MKCVVHLVSMPWSDPRIPSIQNAVLKSYVSREFGEQVPCHSYSGFLSIPIEAQKHHFIPFFNNLSQNAEYPYFFLYHQDFLRHEYGSTTEELIKSFNKAVPAKECALKKTDLGKLKKATHSFIRKFILPKLDPDSTNLIGLTMNFDQVYASLYLYASLKALCPQHRFCFLFGGASAVRPEVVSLFKKLKVDGYSIIGEGEKKLADVIRRCLEAQEASPLRNVVASSEAGVSHFADQKILYSRNLSFFENQISDLSTLPLPHFDEYFESLDRGLGRAVGAELKSRTRLLVEGSRGCFAHCDFCSLNVLWKGFRRQKPQVVFDRVQSLVEKYNLSQIEFVDNVCDAWAEKFSEEVVTKNLKLDMAMALRAHHPEHFWIKLARAGLSQAQVGVECLSGELLKKIGKGTSVVQNVLVLKYLSELGVKCTSNLIVYHPMATPTDVEETKRVVYQVRHFGLLNLSYFKLDFGSPLYDRLSIGQKKNLRPSVYHQFNKPVDSYLVGWGYLVPQTKSPITPTPQATKAWDQFVDWHRKLEANSSKIKFDLVEKENAFGKVTILKTRGNHSQTLTLEGRSAEVYSRAHYGVKVESVAERGLVDYLKKEELLIEVEGTLINLVKRPRERLFESLLLHEPASRHEQKVVARQHDETLHH